MTLRHPVNFHIWQWTAPILSSQSVLVDEERERGFVSPSLPGKEAWEGPLAAGERQAAATRVGPAWGALNRC